MPYETLFALGVIALGVVLVYGLYRYNTRNRANDKVTEEATRALYEQPQSYDDDERERLKRQLK